MQTTHFIRLLDIYELKLTNYKSAQESGSWGKRNCYENREKKKCKQAIKKEKHDCRYTL